MTERRLCGARYARNRGITCGKEPGHLPADPFHKFNPDDPETCEWLDHDSEHQVAAAAPQPEYAHVVRITHDPESHTIEDCHDDCAADLICNGVTDACRVWRECARCRAVLGRVDEHGRDLYDDRLYERGEAHGAEHQRLDGMWMTPTDECIGSACDEHDAYYLVAELPEGDYPVSLDWEEGYVTVRRAAIPPAKCDACGDTGRVPWMHESDPNCYQERDADGMVPCPDCSPGVQAGGGPS